jgi:ATP/maltotriose-dependent transcriptional regulator MalT
VAAHVAQAPPRDDTEEVTWLARAADEAVRIEPGHAVDLLYRARAGLPRPDARPDLQLALARALTWAGRPSEATAVLRRVLDEPTARTVERRARSLLAAALLRSGQVSAAVHQIDLALLIDGPAPPTRARLRAEGAFGRFTTGDLGGAERAAIEALAESAEVGDRMARCLASNCLSWLAYARGDLARSLALADDAIDAAEGDSDEAAVAAGQYAPHLFRAIPLMIADRFDEAAGALATARQRCEHAGTVSLLPAIYAVSSLLRFLRGDWDDALTDVETGLEWADDVGSRLGVLWLHAVRAHVALHRGERAVADAAVAAAHAELDRGGPQTGVDWVLWARALLLADDDPLTAAQTLGAVWDAYESVGVIGNRTGMGPDLVRLALTRVAGLVATGLSNRAIAERLHISPRTVETHIAHASRKLDLSSRVELATLAVARGANA